MAERIKNMREVLILAGIDEINAHGVTGFSIRRVAESCHVSCAAPYKHFKDKRDFIAAIIEYVNEQWRIRQQEVLEACGDDLRRQIVEVSVNYVRFLMEKPYFRSILMLKDAEFDNIYHKVRGHISSRSQRMEQEFFASVSWDEATKRRKLHLVRAMIFGTVFMFDTGELKYTDEVMDNFRYNVDREFDLP
ncbi:MAG: TetR/AcrR family transcriptional regulator [Oscillospiraceae bacterium]|nr:TetR/AcrR family transcriptional regulator [Oscillospiraceae bacterium]